MFDHVNNLLLGFILKIPSESLNSNFDAMFGLNNINLKLSLMDCLVNKTSYLYSKLLPCVYFSFKAQIMKGSIGNSKNVPKKSTSVERIIGIWQYMVCPRCEPKSLQPVCTKF